MIVLLMITLVLGWISGMGWFIARLSSQKEKATNVMTFVFGIFDRFPITAIVKAIKEILCRNKER